MGAEGCTECKNKGGCDHRKGAMMAAIDEALGRLYPGRRWAERDEAVAFRAGVTRPEGARLAGLLAPRLKALTLFRPGGEDEYCDYVYVLCVGRTPSILEIREGTAPLDGERLDEDAGGGAEGDGDGHGKGNDDGEEQLYLRVALSSLARFAGVQQVTMRLRRADGDLVITEAPRGGVFDPILLKRLQGLVAVLAELDIRHVDFGEIVEPPAGFDPGDYGDRYAGAPAIANYLFYPQPCSAITTTVIAAAAR
ncbi:MAG TPA: hypothetical protein VFH68_10760 [Polyangia bacterium]|jgi:hypothetical protein|nr:hypothetical protein [Polyangia bacterium]